MTRTQFEATLQGQADQPGSLFWKHFDASQALGENAFDAHEEWTTATSPIVVKVMNEQLYPNIGALPRGADWARVEPYPATHPNIVAQTDLISRLTARFGDSHPMMATMHGVVASAFHTRGGGVRYEEERHQLADALRDDPDAFRAGLEVIADSLVDHARAYVEAGAEVIFYAALGGERALFTDEEFNEIIRPLDLRVLEAIGELGALRYLHICKENVNLERFVDYPAEIVHAGIHSNSFDLAEMRERFPEAVLVGGYDHTDEIFLGDETPRQSVDAALNQIGSDPRIIVGADCSLPDETTSTRVGEIAGLTTRSHHPEGN